MVPRLYLIRVNSGKIFLAKPYIDNQTVAKSLFPLFHLASSLRHVRNERTPWPSLGPHVQTPLSMFHQAHGLIVFLNVLFQSVGDNLASENKRQINNLEPRGF